MVPYDWYWTTNQAAFSPATPSMADVLIVCLVPAVVLAVCLAVALWESRHPPVAEDRLSRRDRRTIARIEALLRASDPELVHLIDHLTAAMSSGPPPRRTERAS